jgi:hypothetical protein
MTDVENKLNSKNFEKSNEIKMLSDDIKNNQECYNILNDQNKALSIKYTHIKNDYNKLR